jgi:hypothetical protein
MSYSVFVKDTASACDVHNYYLDISRRFIEKLGIQIQGSSSLWPIKLSEDDIVMQNSFQSCELSSLLTMSYLS